jgi:four helix bundle suffix protein
MSYQILKRQIPWRDSYFYQKSEVLYHLTFTFCKRFLPTYGDRTVDQMIQAARSGKQNIIEGMEDGVASSEMQIKLLNVARASLQELREDYKDYIKSRNLQIWTKEHERYKNMQNFCRNNNKIEQYQPYFEIWNDEEMSNIALTLAYMVDTMLNHYLITLEKDFVSKGGIKERMYKARTNYRQDQDNQIQNLKNTIAEQQKEITYLRNLLQQQGLL